MSTTESATAESATPSLSLPGWTRPVAQGATLVLVVALLAWTGVAGMSWTGLLLATLTVVATTLLPGVVVWRVVRPRHGWWAEDIGLGFGVGSVMALLAQVPAGLLGLHWLSAVLVLAVTGVLLAVPVTRDRVRTAETAALPAWWWPLVGTTMLALVPQQRDYFRANPLDWVDNTRLHIDSPLHLALVSQLSERGPTTFPWVQSEALGYHWFSHAWMAQVGATSGAELDSVLLRFMPAVMLVVVPVAVAAAAVRLTDRAWAGPVAALLVVGCGQMNAFGADIFRRPIIPESPTLGLSVPMLMALLVVIVTRWRRTAMPGAWVVLVLLAVGAAGTKGSATPLVIAGLGLAGLMMLLLNRQYAARIFADGCLCVAAVVVVIATVFRGSGAGLHFGFADAAAQTWGGRLLGTDTVWSREIGALVTVMGVLTAAVIGLCLLAFRRWREDPAPWLLAGAGIAGAAAVFCFAHPGNSQGYFAIQAAPVMVLLAVLTLAVLVDEWPLRQVATILLVAVPIGLLAARGPVMLLGPMKRADHSDAFALFATSTVVLLAGVGLAVLLSTQQRLVAGVAALGAAVIVGGLAINWQHLQPAPKPDTIKVERDTDGAISRATIRAARWLRDHSDRNDVVMSNRHCYAPADDPVDGCDSRRMVVAGWSERQVLLEGWTATPRSAEEGPEGRDSITIAYWNLDLLALNDGFIAAPSADAARELREEHDVRWVFVDHLRPHADEAAFAPYATKRATFRGVDIYELRD
ncbi:hypothetical protein ASE01_02120 [Nocardioides sp. Root190]|uniref:hypothetical protein n=1 Tax=Nocardioides sp. Root190 TaxID=1736488 RepID=UPI0006FAA1E4|nr:hypothetical protein [Nocardioides sp. Root190]KRB80305.1 hypothetical protein ASE01_02120 [Nocardioides sp. Root190]